jgi:predicted anti-sigma-YlaC factor YlaD
MKLCWLYQWVLAYRKEANQPLSPRLRSHLGSCPACRHYLQSHARVIQRLVAGAADARQPASPFLHGRIMAAIDRTDPDSAPARPSWQPARWTAALVVIAVLMGWVILWPLPRTALRSPPHAPITRLPTSYPAAAFWPLVDGPEMLRWSAAIEVPLSNEFESCVSDAQAAMAFLAANFLPRDIVPVGP